jgi:hypothetical protein
MIDGAPMYSISHHKPERLAGSRGSRGPRV